MFDNLHRSEWLLRPCTDEQISLSAAEEVVRLFPVERPSFAWCEALNLPWLPEAEILRFHTAIHVDYASTVTVIKPTRESPVIRTILSGEGMYTQPSPNLPDSLAAMNDLLKNAAPMFTNDELKDLSILYVFLVGRDNQCCMSFRHPEGQHKLPTSAYHASYKGRGKERTVTLTSTSGRLNLSYSLQKGRLRLVTAFE